MPRSLSRSVTILRQEGISELLRRIRSHAHPQKRILRHPVVLRVRTGYHGWKRWRSPNKYTDANPFKTITVDLDNIEYVVTNVDTEWGTVVNGSWKRHKITDKSRHQTLRKRFADGESWTELPIDTELGKQKEIVYNRIKEHGYLSQQELEAERSLFSLRDTEIGVGIDRDGTIVHVGGGQHRLSIAKLLEIERVPVHVRVRHAEWQRIRDEIRTTDDKQDLSDSARNAIGHPDLVDLLKKKDWSD